MINNQNINNMSVQDLEYFIEQKMLEILGDPDFGLNLSDEYKNKLIERFRNRSESISHEEVLKEFD